MDKIRVQAKTNWSEISFQNYEIKRNRKNTKSKGLDREKCEHLNVVVPAWWNQFDGDDLDEEINMKSKKKNPSEELCLVA